MRFVGRRMAALTSRRVSRPHWSANCYRITLVPRFETCSGEKKPTMWAIDRHGSRPVGTKLPDYYASLSRLTLLI